MGEIMVSIICNTYNHEQYIAMAMEGFVNQKTNFEYEVLVHDDASTDNTAKIIREYVRKYPKLIKPIYQKENKYSCGVSICNEYQIPRAQGKYIALCEGDDYWIDENKLQKQFEILEAHPEIDICAHGAKKINIQNNEIKLITPAVETCVLPIESVIRGGGGYLATNSLMYRKNILDNPLPFNKMLFMDYTLQVLGSIRGGLYYINDIMSIYRNMTPGSWTDTFNKTNNKEKAIEFNEKWGRMLLQLNEDTSFRFDRIIKKMYLLDMISIHNDRFKNRIIKRDNQETYNDLQVKEKFRVNVITYFPWIYRIIKTIKKQL